MGATFLFSQPLFNLPILFGDWSEFCPIRWKDGRTINDQPRFLYGLSNNLLLVSRIYLCKNKHQILSHDDRILSQIDDQFLPPFVLFYKTGVTRELFNFFISHITAGMSVADVLILWNQNLYDNYGLRKLCFANEVKGTIEQFPDFIVRGEEKVGEKIVTACYMHNYFKKEHLYSEKNVPNDCRGTECRSYF